MVAITFMAKDCVNLMTLASIPNAEADGALVPIFRLHLAPAILDLRTGRPVQSTTVRCRREVVLDPENR